MALTVVGGGSSVWYQGIHDTQSPPGFVASFDLDSGEGAFVFRAKDGASDCYLAFWTASTCGFARVNSSKVSTTLLSLPTGVTGPGRVQVAVDWKLDSADGSRKWLLMALFVDGWEYASFAEDVGDTAYDWTGDGIGFAVTDSNTLIVDDLVISNFSRIVNYVSIDPGESAAQGLARAVGTTRVIYTGRYDGTLRVTRPGDRDSDYTIPLATMLRFMQRDEYRNVLTHVRTIGALHAVDRFDDAEGEVHMHRFAQGDNPNLMSEAEVYDEAGLQLNDAKEQQGSYQLSVPAKVFLERHDRITYDGEDYRSLGVNTTFQMTEDGPEYLTIIEARKYIEA